jgi:hypothetical protein
MGISYESINNSTGIDNSFARRVDGDCGWVKTTAISAHAANKTGSSSSATYDFTAVNTSQCGTLTGSISIQVNASNVGALFPMNYTIAFDVDQNEIFDAGDQYTYGIDNTASTIDINNLAYGRYRITVASSSSCNLKSFDFYVYNCYTVILPLRLMNFNYQGEQNGKRTFKLVVDNITAINNMVLEGKEDGDFKPVATLFGPFDKNEVIINADISAYNIYRLKLTNSAGVVSYSNEIKIYDQNSPVVFWPNPVKNKMFLKLKTSSKGRLSYTIVNAHGIAVTSADIEVMRGEQILTVPLTDLTNGIYYFRMSGQPLQHSEFIRFIK